MNFKPDSLQWVEVQRRELGGEKKIKEAVGFGDPLCCNTENYLKPLFPFSYNLISQ